MVSKKSARPCPCGGRSKRTAVARATLVDEGIRDGEWANQFEYWEFEIGGDQVEVWRDTLERTGAWSVIWDGALDFTGNKKDLLARYPEMKEFL